MPPDLQQPIRGELGRLSTNQGSPGAGQRGRHEDAPGPLRGHVVLVVDVDIAAVHDHAAALPQSASVNTSLFLSSTLGADKNCTLGFREFLGPGCINIKNICGHHYFITS